MNVALLRKVKSHILHHPNQFLMTDWIIKRWGDDQKQFSGDGQKQKFDECGTAGCIAGWACMIKLKQARLDWDVPAKGQTILGLDDDQAERLFFVHDWPEKMREEYISNMNDSPGSLENRARIAAQRIDHFIKTKGEE
jgi:hypothetical protein